MTLDQVRKALDYFLWVKCGVTLPSNKPRYQGRDYKARANSWILKKG